MINAAPRLRLLLVEDDIVDRFAFERMVLARNLPYDVEVASTVADATTALNGGRFDAVISDWNLGDGTALDVLAHAGDAAGIIVTGADAEGRAVSGMKAGARDYLVKDISRSYLDRLPATLESAIARERQARHVRLLSHALLSIDDGVCISDPDDRIAYVNRAFRELIGRDEDALIGRPAEGIIGEGTVEHAGLVLTVDRSTVRDESERIMGSVRVVRDVTARMAAEAALRELTIRDELTGLLNRREFNRILDDEMARCRRHKGHELSVIIVDLDHFKQINDKFGHPVGDSVLRGAGRALQATLRTIDRAARIGGEELAVLLPETGLDGARFAAERLRVAIEGIIVPNAGVRVTASFGVAAYPAYTDASEIIRAADTALYAAKRNGRNRVEVASACASPEAVLT